MKKQLLSLACLTMTLTVSAQTSDFFEPYKQVEMRLPAVPLFLNDPYICFWSAADKLTDRATTHWTGANKPMDGLLRVDGTTYRFMGVATESVLFPIMPMAYDETWTAKATFDKQSNTSWAQPDFDDSSWSTMTGAIGTKKEYPNINTNWDAENSDVYARRHVTLTQEDLDKDLFIVYSHDDVFEMYINGTMVTSTGETWVQNVKERLDGDKKALLHVGDNVIACHCHNTTGGAQLDFGLYQNEKLENAPFEVAVQKSVDVLATNTYYTFVCGNVELDLVFTAPMLIDDPDLLSTPINYLSYQVRSTDGKAHDVQFYFATSPILAVNDASQATTSTTEKKGDITYIKTGTQDQKVLGRTGDIICIDWGYFYLPDYNGTVSLSSSTVCENQFINTGTLPQSELSLSSSSEATMPTIAYMHDFGSVTTDASFMLLAYDEVLDIRYFYKDYKGYWARNGKTIQTAMQELYEGYTDIMTRCRALDKTIYDDGMASGNAKYAEILCATYRQCIAAHKLFEDKDGNMLFFSKENNSNGCVNTVDLTYPSAPLFLLYNPALEKGMITSILDYSKYYGWDKPWAAHDLGQYPHANHQVYGGDMPLEESGNILTLLATIAMMDHDMDYINKYWSILTTWVDYLVENGQDPATQLCTDDFAGHWAHNANLSVKAIMGIAGYALLAQMRGENDTYNKYMNIARNMASIWVTSCREYDHYRLVFVDDEGSDISGTWSQKYNLVWDKLWNLNLFGNRVIDREISYYLTKQNKYGLPLDSRANYTKSDWICWTASMASEKEDFVKFTDLLWKFGNETRSRVPFSDWYRTGDASSVAFIARSVVGGHWMRVLMDRMHNRTEYDANKQWSQAPCELPTKYSEQVDSENVLPEYPRPQMQRSEWLNLNGLWDYTYVKPAATVPADVLDGQILVPFPLESSISGVKQPMPTNLALWYQRTVEIPASWTDKNVIMHIGAADNRVSIIINGKNLGRTTSAYAPITADITKYLKEGENTIAIRIEDTMADGQFVGRQSLNKATKIGDYGHTSVSGIWQTVWLEPVNPAYINSYKADFDGANTLTITPECIGTTDAHRITAIISDGDTEAARATAVAGQAICLTIDNPKLWTPSEPTLYNLHLIMEEGDAAQVVDNITGYTALRTVSIAVDESGAQRILLNGQNLFQAGVMDEGYWPDGLYTAPSDQALIDDITTAKNLGFNLIRKEQKIDCERYYYHCDRLGMLVWQDIPSLNLNTQTLDNTGWYSGTTSAITNSQKKVYKDLVSTIVPALYNHPSIILWTLFDEARGQHDTESLVTFVKELDNTRLVNASSGGNYIQGVGDVHDIHHSTRTLSVDFADTTRPIVFGNYGSNITCVVSGHAWDPSITRGAYTQSQASTLVRNYATALQALATSATPVNAGVYAQLYDVETEHSGLMTYDREVLKVDENIIAEANNSLVESLNHLSNISSIANNGGRVITGCYNVSGQAINPTSASGLIIVRYSDGTADKLVIKAGSLN